MKLKLSEWANLAEIASGVAVLITLIFLIASIRDGTSTTRTLVYQELTSSFNDLFNVILQDDQLTSLWSANRETVAGSMDVGDLTELEIQKLSIMYRSIMRILDSAFSASQYGTVGQSQTDRLLDSACLNYSRLQRINSELEPDILVPISREFRDYLESSCDRETSLLR